VLYLRDLPPTVLVTNLTNEMVSLGTGLLGLKPKEMRPLELAKLTPARVGQAFQALRNAVRGRIVSAALPGVGAAGPGNPQLDEAQRDLVTKLLSIEPVEGVESTVRRTVPDVHPARSRLPKISESTKRHPVPPAQTPVTAAKTPDGARFTPPGVTIDPDVGAGLRRASVPANPENRTAEEVVAAHRARMAERDAAAKTEDKQGSKPAPRGPQESPRGLKMGEAVAASQPAADGLHAVEVAITPTAPPAPAAPPTTPPAATESAPAATPPKTGEAAGLDALNLSPL
jgi:hypothetical protein